MNGIAGRAVRMAVQRSSPNVTAGVGPRLGSPIGEREFGELTGLGSRFAYAGPGYSRLQMNI